MKNTPKRQNPLAMLPASRVGLLDLSSTKKKTIESAIDVPCLKMLCSRTIVYLIKSVKRISLHKGCFSLLLFFFPTFFKRIRVVFLVTYAPLNKMRRGFVFQQMILLLTTI